jgi:hypothetical protein
MVTTEPKPNEKVCPIQCCPVTSLFSYQVVMFFVRVLFFQNISTQGINILKIQNFQTSCMLSINVEVPNILIYQLGWGLLFKGQYTHAMHMVGFANTRLENHLIYHLGRFVTGFCYGFYGFFWAY